MISLTYFVPVNADKIDFDWDRAHGGEVGERRIPIVSGEQNLRAILAFLDQACPFEAVRPYVDQTQLVLPNRTVDPPQRWSFPQCLRKAINDLNAGRAGQS